MYCYYKDSVEKQKSLNFRVAPDLSRIAPFSKTGTEVRPRRFSRGSRIEPAPVRFEALSFKLLSSLRSECFGYEFNVVFLWSLEKMEFCMGPS